MNIGMMQANAPRNSGARTRQGTNKWQSSIKGTNAGMSSSEASEIRRALREKVREAQEENTRSIVTRNLEYANSIREAREKRRMLAAQKKKLRYSYKSISSQILRSKTSYSAKQVAGKAKRQVVLLKQKSMSGKYDSNEVRIALAHAQAMERVAKKKVRHLEEEEMVKVTGGPCAGDIQERMDEEYERENAGVENAVAVQEQSRDIAAQNEMAKMLQEQAQAYQEMCQEQMAAMQRMQEEMAAAMQDSMSELMEEMADSMEDMLEDSGLSELMENLVGTIEVEMDPPEYKMMKIRHRSEEMRDIAKADAEYLKAVFSRLERLKEAIAEVFESNESAGSYNGVPSGGTLVLVGGASEAPAAVDLISTPDASSSAAPAPATGACVNVSL